MLQRGLTNKDESVKPKNGYHKQKFEEATGVSLRFLLPPTIANRILKGEAVEPENFDCASIFFSDVVGYTDLASASTPVQMVALINRIYDTFEKVIARFDVYKVDTIGDAFMIVSGLPERNGDRHASEICQMAVQIQKAVKNCSIDHIPEKNLEVRVGVHSGPIGAGVVGTTPPRYCLFGPTVSFAAKLEGNGKPTAIHVSEATKTILEKSHNSFSFNYHGTLNLKGKMEQKTYWLIPSPLENGREQSTRQPSSF